MLHIKNIEDSRNVFKALGSDIRIDIIKKLLEKKEMNMNEIAKSLNLTNGAVTNHVRKLEDCGIVNVYSKYTGHGNEKVCSVQLDKILVNLTEDETEEKGIFDTEIKIGLYLDHKIFPTCGIATQKNLIGVVDDPRFFAHGDRIDAQILWFTKGYIEYQVPNLLPIAQKIDQLTLTFEIGSEAPGVNNDWPSDICFYLNDTYIGMWTSPGDFGDVRGVFTPDWWFPNWNQYGLLKTIVVNQEGSFIDGLMISDVTISNFKLDYRSEIRFKFAVEDDSKNVGGLTIFGKKFGNYNQNIRVRIHHSSMKDLDHRKKVASL